MDSDPLKVYLDPFNGSECTVWESYRNLIANGYKPLGITNCLNFGNPENAVVGHQLVESINGISKACKDIGIPVVSGNVSLYNESSNNRILPTPTIGMIGYCESVNSLIPSSFSDNQTVFVIGKQVNQNSDTGGSLYQRILYNEINGKVDTVDINLEKNLEKVIQKLKEQSLLKGCIDVSKGGIFFALFSALYAEKTGFTGDFEIDEKLLFGEITGRYLISTDDPENTENYLVKASIPFKKLGICGGNLLKLGDLEFDINALFEVYENSLEMRLRS